MRGTCQFIAVHKFRLLCIHQFKQSRRLSKAIFYITGIIKDKNSSGAGLRMFSEGYKPCEEEGKRRLGLWIQPTHPANKPELTLINSLTRKKEVFIPQTGNKVSFYICGPTVYDAAHLGHARSYISFDIVRRVLQFYFGYDVQYVMNVTDIDDKIINRARQRHLVAAYLSKEISVRQMIDDIQSALKGSSLNYVTHLVKMTLKPFNQLKIEQETVEEKKKAAISLVQKTDEAVGKLEYLLGKESSEEELEEAKDCALDAAKDILGVWLDVEGGYEVTDLDIFTKHARYFENEFHQGIIHILHCHANGLERL